MSNQQATVKPGSTSCPPFSPGTYKEKKGAPDSVPYYVDAFLLAQRAQRHSSHTLAFYSKYLNYFLWFLEHEGFPTALQDISSNHIRLFFVYLHEQNTGRWGSSHPGANRPLSAHGIHAFARAVRAFLRWATKEAHLAHNPFDNVDMPKLPDAWKVSTFTEEEIAALMGACDRMGLPFIIQRNRAILAILLDSGIRASELLGLQVEDIDPRQGLFTVRGKGDKQRYVVTGNFARRELWCYLTNFRLKMETPDAALFVTRLGARLTYNGLARVFRDLRRLSGIQRVSVRAHVCRHTFATVAHRNGMKAATLQEALGHTDFNTTRRFYLDIAPEDIAAEHALYGPLDNMVKKGMGFQGNKGAMPSPELPPADVLLSEVTRTNYRAVARKYGCSDTAIRKRLKKAGLLL
jgi:integrase/recombinase XerC